MNRSSSYSICAMLFPLALAAAASAQDVRRLCDFETAADVRLWEMAAGTPQLVAEGVAHGKHALEIRFDPKGEYHPAYLSSWRLPRDWSGYDALVLEVFNPADEPIPATLLIADRAWETSGRSYWNRHNAGTTFAPGRTSWLIPTGGLYRGEAGSRNNDIKRNIDVNSITRLDFGFGRKGSTGRVIIDDLRLVKSVAPAGVWAFDFGPPDQSVMLGWTGVSSATAYSRQRGYGWGPTGGTPWNGAARDTTFGPALLRDFCEGGGYRFHIDVPAGKYRVTLIYENSGYWGGEQARQTTRRVSVDGREVYRETRPDGEAHALFRFEDVEPIGVDIWDTYMKAELARPVSFDAQAAAGGLTLAFASDRPFGSKLSAMVVHRADDAAAAKWVAGQLDEVAAEFRGKAVCLDKPAGAFELPAAWRPLRMAAWPVDLEQDVTPNSLPPATLAAPDALALTRLTARDATATFCLAVRPAADLGRCGLRFDWQKGPGKLPASVSAVWYNTSRGFNSIAYHVRAHTLRECSAVTLPKDVTRELIVKVRVPADAAAGQYEGTLQIQPAGGGAALRVPIRLKVAPVTLDRGTEFHMGFFGLMPPDLLPAERREEALEQTLDMLREYGMNMVSDGPNWRLTGWRDGEPVIDFAEMDRFAAILRKHGFTGALNGYGGARFVGLHDGYEKGATGAKVERDSGLPYAEAMMRAWRAVDRHARANDWPLIWYAMCDETRVRDVAERELAFMKQMAAVSAAFPKIVRTSGSYSVSFARRPTDPEDMLYWHQRFFEVLDISDLNGHDPTVMAEAKELGKEVQIYNQGTSRYSFGLYQWGEFSKGVTARTQWHLNVLHGYQFFDLDGREPDSGVICYGRRSIWPTIAFERCREGAQDFYLYNALARRVAEAQHSSTKIPGLGAAETLLGELSSSVALNQRQPPPGYDPEQTKARVIAALEALVP